MTAPMQHEHHVSRDEYRGTGDYPDPLERRAVRADRVREREDDERQPYDRGHRAYRAWVAGV